MEAKEYAEKIANQMRKGVLTYCVMKVCKHPKYTSEIIDSLKEYDLMVVEGTIYPMLSRLQKDGILDYEWQESTQGPPRKYYQLTDLGGEVLKDLDDKIKKINRAVTKL